MQYLTIWNFHNSGTAKYQSILVSRANFVPALTNLILFTYFYALRALQYRFKKKKKKKKKNNNNKKKKKKKKKTSWNIPYFQSVWFRKITYHFKFQQ